MDNKAKGMVQTVLGLRHPSELGVTLTHEHLLIDLTCYFRMPEEATARAIVDKPITMEMLGSLRKHFYHSKDAQTMFDENLAVEEILKYKYTYVENMKEVIENIRAMYPKLFFGNKLNISQL